MPDVSDSVAEAVEAENSPLNSLVALLVAVTATFMAICNIKDGNITQGMAQAQAGSVDTWSYYQSKSTKQNIAESTLDLLTIQRDMATGPERDVLEKRVTQYAANVQRYEKEKAEIKAKAEQLQKDYDALNVHDDQFDMSDAALSVAIAILGVTALTRKKWLLVFACCFLAFGFFFGLAGFLGWSVHPDFIARWLS
jgi:hypothetical protein